MKAIKALLFSAVALSPLVANAASNWYGVVSIGQGTYDVSKSDFEGGAAEEGVTINSSKLDDNDTGYKFQVGYQFTPNLAVEGGLIDLGRFHYKAGFTADTDIGATSGSAQTSGHTYIFNADAVGTLPLGAGFSIFGKLGVAVATVDGDVSSTATFLSTGATGSFSDSSSKTSVVPTFGVGASFDLNETLSVRIEYERFADIDTGDGKVDADLASLGLVAHF